jgi:hypothetical protein
MEDEMDTFEEMASVDGEDEEMEDSESADEDEE